MLRELIVASSRVILLGSILARASATDWPQWQGPTRTGRLSAGVSLPAKLPDEPKILWHVKTEGGFASPVVAGGTVFLFDHQAGREVLHALAVTDGHELWRADVDATFTDSQGPPGPRCTPLIDDDRVYAQSCRGELQCFKVANGQLLWQANYVRDFGAIFMGEKGNTPGAGRHGNNGSPVIDSDWLYASAGSTNGAGMVCFDKRSGAIRWKSGNEIAAYAAPVVTTIAGRRQVVNFMADALTAFDAKDGRQLWRVPIKTAFARHVTTPIIQDDLVVVSSHQYGLLAIKVISDASTPTGFAAHELWKSADAAMNFSCPVAVGGALYGLGPTKNVVCVDLATGNLRWQQEGWITSSAEKAHAAFLTDGRTLLMLGDDGMLFHFAADPTQAKELGRVQLCRVNWCNPALADGRLYVRDNIKSPGELLAVEMK